MGSADQPSRGSNGAGNGNSGTVVWAPKPIETDSENEARLDLAQLWSILREGHRAVALITIAVFSLVMVVTMAARMDFTLRSSLYLGDLQGNGALLDALSSQFGMEKGEVGTEIEIIRSRELMTQAVLASGLNTRLTPSGWGPPRYWRWRLEQRNVGALQGAWNELRAVSTRLTGTGSGDRREVELWFKTPTEYEVREHDEVLGSSKLGDILMLPGLELTLIPGMERTPKADSRFVLEVIPLQDVLDDVNRNFTAKAPKVSLGTQVNVVHLELTSKWPYHARMFLEELMRGYLDQNLAWKTEEAAAAERFLSKQLENIRASLDKSGQDLAEFKKNSTMIVLSEEAKSMIEQMGTLEQQRVAARLQVDALTQVKNALAKGNVPTEAYLVGEAQDTVLMAMSENLVKAQQAYKSLSEQFTPDYPPVREARAALESQLKAVQSYVKSRLGRAQEQVLSLDAAVQRYTEKLKELPDAELKLATLTQETDVYSKLYQFLLERQQQAALTKASTISKSRVLDAPILPIMEASPKLRKRIALGLILGLLFGIGFVIARWRLATTFQSEAEVRKILPGVALFASIPRRPEEKRADSAGALGPFDGVADLRSPFAEAFRLLRTNLYYSGSRDRDKVILVSSPGPGDGKTATTLCLAGILAADGKRVLVVDGDMRKPSHHVLLRQAQHPGFSGILTNETHWSQAVHSVRTPFGEFSSISTGIVPPNPAELLSSPALGTFLSEAKEKFDFILLDSPPFPLVSDAFVLSQYADRNLSVIRVGRTHRRVAEEHVRRLAAATAHYGFVINDVPAGHGYGYGYNYGYGYGAPDRKRKHLARRDKRGNKDASNS